MQMNKKEALIEQEKLSHSDIIDSINDYFPNREDKSTKNRFIYKNKDYPIMNIIYMAIKFHNDKSDKKINPKGYNNISACKETLQKHLKSEISF